MHYLETNDWILINDVIYKINSIKDISKLQKTFLNLIKILIPYDRASFYLVKNYGSHLLGHPVGINISNDELQRYIDENGEQLDYTSWVFISAKSMVYRETDLLSDEKREDSLYYKIAYAPNNIHFSAQLSIVYNEVFLGIISLYRSKNNDDFSDKDLFILDMLKDHLAYRLSQEYLKVEQNTVTSKDIKNLDIFTDQYQLTKRESEVFSLLAKGLTNAEISSELFISPCTLKKHILRVYKKTGVKNRLQLFRLVEK